MKKAFPKSIGHDLCSTPCPVLTTWHGMTTTNINKEELGKDINYVFTFRWGKRVATHSTMNVVKTKNMYCTAERCITSWAVLNSHHASIQSTSGILTKIQALPTTIIPDFKQSKNDQKSLCVNKRLTPPTPLSSSPLYPTLYERKPWIS